MNIRLNSLRIRNFKGIKELSIEANGYDVVIRGDNATGKTTVKDAFTWLLFNKNSLGKTDFGIKPKDEQGEIIHNLEVSVEATFLIDGATTKTFKKTLTENWTRKRGAAQAVFTGNESSYYVNEVPKKKTEYANAVSEIIGEDVFKIITDPLYFNEQMKWQDRRKMLIEVCGDISDETILKSNPDFDPLAKELNGRTVDEYKSILAKDMKSINKELEMLPVKINEAELAKPDADEVQINETRREAINSEIEQLSYKRTELVNGSALVTLKGERDELNRKIADCDNYHSQVEFMDESEIIKDLNDCKKMISALELEVKSIDRQLEANTETKKALSEKWDKHFKEVFLGEDCPTCGRPFPSEEIEARRKEFNAKKAERLDAIENKLKKVKANDSELMLEKATRLKDIETLTNSFYDAENQLAEQRLEYNNKLNEAKAKALEQKTEYSNELASVMDRIKNYEQEVIGKVKEVEEQIAILVSEKAEIDAMVAKAIVIEQQDKRITELRERQESLAAEYMRLDGLMFLAENFIKTKVDMLNEKINSHFKYARFKLFESQINEGIKETCEVTFKGIPYSDLNNAGRINIGLDVINTLCDKYKVTAPIFIDNAEAVTRVADTDSQQIRLVVDERHKKLNIERE